MPHKPLPVVSDHLLHLSLGEGSERSPVTVGSEEWYCWLAEEQNRSFSFRNAQGTFTVRRESKRHSWYWYIYRKSGGKLRKAYLGKTEELTLTRLALAAAMLVAQPGDDAGAGRHNTSEQVYPDHTGPLSDEQLLLQTSTNRSQNRPESLNRSTFPTPLTSLIGRHQEAATCSALLQRAQVRLLILTGPGGIGKTRLALQIATDLQQNFSDGVCFVPLEPLRDPSLVASAIAYALNLRETTRTSVIDQLKDILRDQHLLLLLDNFEQVAPAAPLLADLLAACPRLKVLVSSRTRLHIRGEQEYVVPPLALPASEQFVENGAWPQFAAVALFLQRARAVQPEFQITGSSIRIIAEICLRLEGVPLAIELAAARINHLPPQALLSALKRRLPLLTNGPQDAPVRQQTMRNTLAWSYSLLDPWEQWLLRRLSVFVGGFTLQAAEAVCSVPGDDATAGTASVFDGIASLIDKSLLFQMQREGEEPRFGMLEMTREYGQEMLALCEETEAVRQAHALSYLALVEQAAHAWEGPLHAMWLARLEREHDNLRAAMQWSLELEEDGKHLDVACRFGGALRSFWQVRGHFREGRAFLEHVLAHSEGKETSWRTKVLNDAILLAISQGDHVWGEALCLENLLRSRELEDHCVIAHALYLLGWLTLLKGDLATAQARLLESLTLFREMDDRRGSLVALFWVGVTATYQGEYPRARAVFEQTLAMQRELANKRGIAWSLFHLAWVRFLSQSDLSPLHSLLTEAKALFQEISDPWGNAECCQLLGRLAFQHSDTITAVSLLEQSLMIFKEIGNRRGTARALLLLGEVAMKQQNWARARLLYEESMAEAQEVSDTLEIASALEGIAGAAATEGAALAGVLWAAQLWGAAEALREFMGAPLPPVEHAIYKERVDAARASIGRRLFSAYWAQGRTMTPEQALATQGKTLMPPQTGRSTELPLLSSRSAATDLAGLTVREVEVLRWVARGLTDAQVAEQLVISPRTVTSHLSSIYNKLGVASRTAATRKALDHHLI